jgi:hypothetical protein
MKAHAKHIRQSPDLVALGAVPGDPGGVVLTLLRYPAEQQREVVCDWVVCAAQQEPEDAPVARGEPVPTVSFAESERASHAVELADLHALRPRARVVAPPSGATPRERALELTGALSAPTRPTVLGPLDPVKAADGLLAFLGLHGYLAVVPLQVANAVDGWPVAEGAVGASLVVVVEPVWQRELARALER